MRGWSGYGWSWIIGQKIWFSVQFMMSNDVPTSAIGQTQFYGIYFLKL